VIALSQHKPKLLMWQEGQTFLSWFLPGRCCAKRNDLVDAQSDDLFDSHGRSLAWVDDLFSCRMDYNHKLDEYFLMEGD